MARKIPVADEVIAEVALTKLIELGELVPTADGEVPTYSIVALFLTSAAKVRYQQSTRQLVLTFDLGMSPAEDA